MGYGFESARTDYIQLVSDFPRGAELVRVPKSVVFETAYSQAVIVVVGQLELFSQLLYPMLSQLS
jgi:hypothetical protein